MSQTCQQPQAHPARCGCVQTPSIEMMEQGSLAANYDISQETAGKVWEAMENSRKLRAAMPHAGGEVEVFNGWVNGCPEQVELVMEKDHRAHVTRLQAEIAALQQKLTKANLSCHDLAHKLADKWGSVQGAQFETVKALRYLNEELQQRLNTADQRVDELQSESFEALYNAAIEERDAAQSEMAKALDLLRAIYESGSYKGEIVFRVRELLAHQSAPAACLTPANHECPNDGVGACKKCPNAPTAKGEGDE